MRDDWKHASGRWMRRSTAVRVGGVYLAVAAVWIVGSDPALRALGLEPAGPLARAADFAGVVFASALVLAFFARREPDRPAPVDAGPRPLAGEHLLRADGPHAARDEVVRVVESITDDFFALDRDWRFTYVNRNAERFFGRSREELLGRRFWDVFPVAVDTPFQRAYVQSMEERVPLTFEAPSSLSPGRWLEVRTYPSDDGIVVYARDVTERKRAETELRRQKVRFENLFESAPEGIAIVDQEDRILRANAEFGRMFGYAHEQVIGRTIQELIVSPDQYAPSLEITRRTAREGQRVRTEAVRRRADGTPIDVSILTVPFREEASRETLAYGIYRDITGRRDAEQALRESEEKFRVLVEASLDAIFIATVDGRILDCNDAACRMFGYAKDDLIGMTNADLMPDESAGTLPDLVTEVTGDEPVERVNRRSDGTCFPTEVATKFVRVGGEKRLIAYVRDISARKQLEEQFRQAQKMEAVGRLAGGIAHDFNNLMMTVQGYARLVMEDVPQDGPTHEDLAEIDRAAERAAKLTRQLLAFGREQVLNPTVLDLNGVVRGMEHMVRRTIGEDVEVVIDLASDARPIEADPGQLEQMIVNLVVNARDAMAEGGTLTLRTDDVRIEAARGRRRARALPSGRYTLLTVADTGHGMDDETQERIFEPFFTTKDKGKGTGLGLAMVYGGVRQSGGRIEVDSAPGRGSTFRIYFPCAESPLDEPVPARAVAPAGGALAGEETVLVVEDEDSVRRVVCRALRRYGYNVLEAADGEAALRAVREHAAPIDLILSDLVMPRMSGQEMRARLDRDGCRTPTVFMTGYSRDAVDHRARLEGTHEVLAKPVDPDRLVRVVRDALDAGRNA